MMTKLKALCATAYGPSACERVNIFAHKPHTLTYVRGKLFKRCVS